MRFPRTLSLYLAREMSLFTLLCFSGIAFVLVCQQLLERLETLLEVGLDGPHALLVLQYVFAILAPHALPMAFAFGVTLAVGRLAAVKRHDILLRAWADLSKTFPDWSLKIFGRGPLQKSLDALTDELGIADHVELGVHTDTISDEYADAAILAHPADYEGFGLAVGEALAHAVPAVAFADCPGANTLIQDGVNGRLVDPGADRTAAFREALGELMANVELRARLSAAGPGSMAQYAPKAVYDLWENLLCAGEQHAGGNPE